MVMHSCSWHTQVDFVISGSHKIFYFEDGIEPEELVATKWVDDDVTKEVRRQRKICPYPESAVWDGEGDVDMEGNWKCKSLF